MKDDQNQEIEQLIDENQRANEAEMAALNNEHQRNREANALNNNNINNFFNNMANNEVPDDDAELNDLENQVNNELNQQNINHENLQNNEEDIEIQQLNQEIEQEDADLLNRAIQNQQNQNNLQNQPENQNLQGQNAGNNQNEWVNVEKDEINQIQNQERQEQINNLNASAQRMREADAGMNAAANNIDNNLREAQRRQRQQDLERQQEEIRRIRQQNQQRVRDMLRQQQQERQLREQQRRQMEENREFLRNVYKSGRNDFAARAQKGYESIMKFFAPDNGFQYPPGITPELAAAVVIGASIDGNWLKDHYPDKIKEAGSLENLQKKILNDITSDGAVEPFVYETVMNSFVRATGAVNAFGAGDQSKVKDYLGNFANYSAKTVGDIKAADANLSDGYNPEQLMYKFCQEVVINGPLQVVPNAGEFTPINSIKLNSLSKQIDAMKAAEQRKQRLINEVGTLTPAQKEELVSEMLLDNFIANMANIEKKKLEAATKKNREDTFKNIGLNEQNPKWNEYTASQGDFIANKAKEASYIINKNTVSEFDVFMRIPGAREYLKRTYMEKIKESDIYRNIVNSQTPKDMVDNLLTADKVAVNGVNAIPGFKIDPAVKEQAKQLNDKYRPKMEEQLSQVNREMVHKAMGSARAEDTIGLNRIDPLDLDHDSVSKMAEEINSMYQTIKKNDTITGSRNYGDMKTALKELRDYTKKLADKKTSMGGPEAEKYKTLVNKVDNLADHYLKNKKNLDDPASLNKVNGVRTLKRRLLSSTRNIDNALKISKKNHSQKLFGDKFREFDHYDQTREKNNPFYGDKYLEDDSRKIHSGACSVFTTERTAGVSIAIMCMAASGQYSFEDIMDPTKCVNEKRTIYDDVMKTLRDGDNPISREKIARTIHDGRIATDRMLEEQVRQIDFKNVDIYNDKQFLMTANMYQARFDVEQEMMRITPDYIRVAKETNPNFRDMRDAKVIWSPIMEIRQSMEHLKKNAYDAETSTDPLIATNKAAQIMSDTERIRSFLEKMDQKQQEGRDIPVNDWFNMDEHAQLSATSSGLEFALVNKVPFREHPEDIKPLMPKMLDGSLMKGVKYEIDMVKGGTKITAGFPDKEDIHIEAVNIEFLKKTDEAIRRLEGGKNNYANKKDFIKDSAYAIFGQMYRANGKHTPIDASTGKKLSLEEFMQKQLKLGVFEKSLRSKSDPKNFKLPEDIAKMARNKAKMQGIIKNHIEKKAAKRSGRSRTNNKQPSVTNKAPNNAANSSSRNASSASIS